MATFKCIDCGLVKPVATLGGTGYATYEGRPVCYDCCAIRDARAMKETGMATLYWDGHAVTNWPGTLKFLPLGAPVKRRHNIAGSVTYVWFRDRDGQPWSGRNVGEGTQSIHCRRITERAFRR